MKVIIGRERGIYEKGEIRKTKKGLEILARYSLGIEMRANKYWETEKEMQIMR